MGMLLQQIVRAFAGENRLHADDVLSPNVAPDAQNNDYARSTIRKRKGYAKLHNVAILEGGVKIENANKTKCIWIPNLAVYIFTGEFTIEIFVRLLDMPSSDIDLIGMFESATGGWRIRLLSTGAVRGEIVDGTPSNQVVDSAASTVEAGGRYHIVLTRNSNDTLIMYVNGVLTSTASVAGMTTTARPLFVGSGTGLVPQTQTSNIIVDDIRIWDTALSAAMLDASTKRELNATELEDANLVGYWRLNDASWNICRDESVNKNHGAFADVGVTAGPSFEKGLVPQGSEDDYAIRFDGIDDSAEALYNAAWAPILDTGNKWTIEGWVRVDKDTGSSDRYICDLGREASGNGAVFTVFVGAGLNLRYTYSTTTTHNNQTNSPGYTLTIGEPFHFAIVRDGASIFTYINGELIDTETGVTTENGPTSSDGHGFFLGHLFDSPLTGFGPFTIDDVRLWKSARSQTEIQENFASEFSDTKNANLVGYWRFNAADKELDETNNSDFVLGGLDEKPQWSEGLVFPQTPTRMLMVAPFGQPQRSDEVRSGINPFRRELIAATNTGFWKIANGDIVKLRDFAQNKIGGNGLFDWCVFQDKLIFCNGLEDNSKYDGGESPTSVTIDTPTTAPTEALSGSGSGWSGNTGDHKYRYSFRNEKDGAESLGSAASDAATVISTTDTVELSVIEVSSDPQVTHVRIYRLDPNATVYRFLADITTGTTTYSDTGTAITANLAINDLRGPLNPYRYCAVYQNRQWFANTAAKPSSLVFSESDTIDFPASNDLLVDRGDGDEITALWAAFGGLIVFKQHAIFFLSGQGATTFQVHKLVANQGCSAGQTIAQSPNGLYFLGADGVYLFNGQTVQYVSNSQQTEFIKIVPDQRRFSTAAYDPETHQYVISFGAAVRQAGAYVDVNSSLFSNYWKLADLTDSVGSVTLSEVGDPQSITDSRRGAVKSLDGAADSFTGSLTLPTGDYSYGFWCTIDDLSINQFFLFMAGDDNPVSRMQLTLSTKIQTTHTGTSSAASVSANLSSLLGNDVWIHVVFARSTSAMRLYFNGVLVARLITTTDTASPGANETIFIGSDSAGANTLAGKIQNVFLIDGTAIETWQVEEIFRYESATEFPELEETSMVFDEETQSWAKWDRRFDYLTVGEHSENRSEVFAAKNGFIHQLFEGKTDGGSFLDGSTIVASGSVSANSTATITDASAAFPTKGNGLAGATVTVKSSADTTVQKRLIIANIATALYLDRPFSPAITGTYYIAPIDWYWESPWMDMDDTFLMKRWKYLFLQLKESSATVTFKWKTTESETWASQTFSAVDEIMRLEIPARGRKLKIRFEHIVPNLDVEIESFQAAFNPRRLV